MREQKIPPQAGDDRAAGTDRKAGRDPKAERLAAALRANLARRKAQKRARGAGDGAAGDGGQEQG